ncbi:cytochrome P450 71A1-like [Papaver somniferum]|uniref:cytochrome P450 71A1-like n=1 Tax=Papaver somniferum TaxID=3469 RepID=UPI000E702CD3|nr:cytochrome P450 71A1-like [Papaver somniferum]
MLRKTAQDIDIFFNQIIDDRIRINSQVDKTDHHGKDEKRNFIDILLHAGKNNLSFTRDCMKGIIMDMFVGGVDTSATVLDWAMAELIKNPKLMKKAQEEVRRVAAGNKTNKVEEQDINKMDYLKCIIKETLRMHPPVPTLSRKPSADAKLGGYDLPPNTDIFLNVWTVQRDPKLWDKPEDFRPERFIDNPIDFKGQY